MTYPFPAGEDLVASGLAVDSNFPGVSSTPSISSYAPEIISVLPALWNISGDECGGITPEESFRPPSWNDAGESTLTNTEQRDWHTLAV